MHCSIIIRKGWFCSARLYCKDHHEYIEDRYGFYLVGYHATDMQCETGKALIKKEKEEEAFKIRINRIENQVHDLTNMVLELDKKKKRGTVLTGAK